jgi:transcriptional regulator with XRE-family HTH domain
MAKIYKYKTPLNTLRADNGYTVRGLAKELGVSSSGSVSHWLSGRTKVPEQYVKPLAKLFGVSPDVITGTVSEQKKPRKKCNRPITRAAHTFKDNFWSRKRVESGLTIDMMAEKVGLTSSTAGRYIIGMQIPEDEVIQRFCDLFNVDFMVGKGEFTKMHRSYKTGSNKLVASYKGPKPVRSDVGPIIDDEPVTESNANLIELLYGKVPYADFIKIIEILDQTNATSLEDIYGKVDFATFNLVKTTVDMAT